ncbi:MAG: hypothetical protein J3K34DRAFT_408556 [Monoraphidium minutum]|nr:MAG: hypothetical protein J3K34DRAFT_408556 [Monoraphidium minutum]
MAAQKFQELMRVLLAMLRLAATCCRGASAEAGPAAKKFKPTCIPVFAPRTRGIKPSRLGSVTYALKVLEMFPDVVARLEQPQNKSTFFIPVDAAMEAALGAFTSKYQHAAALLGLNATTVGFDLVMKALNPGALQDMLDAHTVVNTKIVFKRKPKRKPAAGTHYTTMYGTQLSVPAYTGREKTGPRSGWGLMTTTSPKS